MKLSPPSLFFFLENLTLVDPSCLCKLYLSIYLYIYIYIYIQIQIYNFFFPLAASHGMRNFPNQASNLHALQSKHKVLTTRPPEKPLVEVLESTCQFLHIVSCYFGWGSTDSRAFEQNSHSNTLNLPIQEHGIFSTYVFNFSQQ